MTMQINIPVYGFIQEKQECEIKQHKYNLLATLLVLFSKTFTCNAWSFIYKVRYLNYSLGLFIGI